MFSMMKNFLREKEPEMDGVVLSDLHVGCVVGFGFMPQRNISGKRLPVTEVNSYLFGEDSFVAYRLEGENADVNLIVAENNGTDTYLALSQPLEDCLIEPLFGATAPKSWFSLTKGDVVTADTEALGIPTGWFAPSYRLVMATHGRILEGDFRMRKPAGRLSLSRPFEYALLVDEDNTHALEAEKYEDGTLKIFATVYRPATDIGEISRIGLVRSNAFIPAKSEVTLPPMPEIRSFSSEPEEEAEVLQEEEKANGKMHSFVEETQNEAVAVHGKFGLLQPSNATQQALPMSGMLTCDTRLAGRIIDEAQRNQMLLSELVRKVIDLPARINEQVLIPFSLTDAEYAELARRYQLPLSDKEAVKQKVVEELKAFVGDRK